MPAVNCLSTTQDGDGRLWFASRSGMMSYDGEQWKVCEGFGDPENLKPPIHCSADSMGRIWATTIFEVSYLKDGKWHEFPGPPGRRKIRNTQIETIWHKGNPVVLIRYTDGNFMIYREGKWQRVHWTSLEHPPTETGPIVKSTDAFLLTTKDGIFRVDPATGDASPFDLPDSTKNIRGATFDEIRGELWLVGEDWIAKLKRIEGKLDPSSFSFVKSQIQLRPFFSRSPDLQVVADGRGGLWFGNVFSIFHLSIDGDLKRVRPQNGLVAEGVNSFFRDREQNIWIASGRGLTKIISQRFTSYDHDHGLLDDEVSAISQLPDGRIVLGHQGGITLLGPQGTQTIHFDGNDSTSRTMDLKVDPTGSVWACCHFAGLARISEPSQLDFIHALPNIRINSVAFDPQGEIWIGADDGLYKVVGNKLEAIQLPVPSHASAERYGVRRLVTGKSGTIYAAVPRSGILGITKGEFRTWQTAPELLDVYSAIETEKGQVWCGSSSGLGHLINNRFELSHNPRIKGPVYALLEDRQENLWIGTDRGVYVWNGKQLRRFHSGNGLLGAETNRAALFESREGDIWIGTARGVSRYRSELDTRVPVKPQVLLGNISSTDSEFSFASARSLPPESNDVSFAFSASSFIDESQVKFRIKLENYDDAWSTPKVLPSRKIRYTNLPAGEYRIHVQAIDAEGNASDIVVSPTLTIESHFYQETWFLQLCVLAVLGLGWAGFAFWNQRIYSNELEIQVQKRTEELRKAEKTHAQVARLESLGVLAGGIAHDFNNLLTAVTGYTSLISKDKFLSSNSKQFVKEVENACGRAQGLTKQLLTFSRGGAPVRKMTSITDIIEEAATFSLRGSNVECEFDFEEGIPEAHVDADQFHQIINNLTINARQAMPQGGSIRFRVRSIVDENDERHLEILVTDQGVGIPADVVPRIFDPYFSTKSEGSGLGLAIVHSIVHKHGGRITVDSTSEQGTVFKITIPSSASEPTLEPTQQSHGVLRPQKVLVLDDEESICRFVQYALESRGCEVVTVSDGEDAIRVYRSALNANKRFRTVIADLTIPGGMGGAQAGREIMKIDPAAQIIVTSGYANEPTLSNYAVQGFAGKLPKPFSLTQLISTLSSVPANSTECNNEA